MKENSNIIMFPPTSFRQFANIYTRQSNGGTVSARGEFYIRHWLIARKVDYTPTPFPDW